MAFKGYFQDIFRFENSAIDNAIILIIIMNIWVQFGNQVMPILEEAVLSEFYDFRDYKK